VIPVRAGILRDATLFGDRSVASLSGDGKPSTRCQQPIVAAGVTWFAFAREKSTSRGTGS